MITKKEMIEALAKFPDDIEILVGPGDYEDVNEIMAIACLTSTERPEDRAILLCWDKKTVDRMKAKKEVA